MYIAVAIATAMGACSRSHVGILLYRFRATTSFNSRCFGDAAIPVHIDVLQGHGDLGTPAIGCQMHVRCMSDACQIHVYNQYTLGPWSPQHLYAIGARVMTRLGARVMISLRPQLELMLRLAFLLVRMLMLKLRLTLGLRLQLRLRLRVRRILRGFQGSNTVNHHRNLPCSPVQ